MHRHLLPLVLALSISIPALPSELRLALDPGDTEITFLLEATGHKVQGTLGLTNGELTFDPETGAASGQLVLDATSAETGSKGRDKNMHRKVLESEAYPEIIFQVQAVEGTLPTSGTGEIRVRGALSIHGSEHEIELPVRLEVDGGRFTAETQLTVPYVEWGMKDPSVLLLRVAKTVEVSATGKGRIFPAGAS